MILRVSAGVLLLLQTAGSKTIEKTSMEQLTQFVSKTFQGPVTTANNKKGLSAVTLSVAQILGRSSSPEEPTRPGEHTDCNHHSATSMY